MNVVSNGQGGRAPAIRPVSGVANNGPTVLRIGLGARLRHKRELAGLTREEAGEAIRGSAAKISRLELGRVGYKERDVSDLLTRYGVVDPEERAEFLARSGGPRPRLVAPLLRPAAVLVRDVPRHGAGRVHDPDLRAAVRARAAADPPLRTCRHAARALRRGRGRAPRRAADAPPGHPVRARAAPPSGPSSTRPHCGAASRARNCSASRSTARRAEPASNVALQIARLRYGGHAAAGGPSPSCGSASRTCPTSSTSSSSRARSTWTSGSTSTTTPW